jgi:hypothetical protein
MINIKRQMNTKVNVIINNDIIFRVCLGNANHGLLIWVPSQMFPKHSDYRRRHRRQYDSICAAIIIFAFYFVTCWCQISREY